MRERDPLREAIDSIDTSSLSRGDFVLVRFGSRGQSLAMILGARNRHRYQLIKLAGGRDPLRWPSVYNCDAILCRASDEAVRKRSGLEPAELRSRVLTKISDRRAVAEAHAEQLESDQPEPGDVVIGRHRSGVVVGVERDARGRIVELRAELVGFETRARTIAGKRLGRFVTIKPGAYRGIAGRDRASRLARLAYLGLIGDQLHDQRTSAIGPIYDEIVAELSQKK